jgi:hypothetical protein
MSGARCAPIVAQNWRANVQPETIWEASSEGAGQIAQPALAAVRTFFRCRAALD